jgi:uncharacterized membrane protein
MHKATKILIQTKRIGKLRLNKIVSLVFERCDYELDEGMVPVGWWVSIKGRECVQDPIGYGVTKKKAKDEFVTEFEKSPNVGDLLCQ